MLPSSECVTLARFYRVPITLAVGQTVFDITQVMEYDFLWRAVAAPRTDNVLVRFRAAKNYYLSNQRIPLTLLTGGGVISRAWEPEFLIPKGEAISLEAENQTGAAVSAFVVLVGVDILVPNTLEVG